MMCKMLHAWGAMPMPSYAAAAQVGQSDERRAASDEALAPVPAALWLHMSVLPCVTCGACIHALMTRNGSPGLHSGQNLFSVDPGMQVRM